ncbi:MAG TPA: DUF1028 domain-containing protein [Ktedonobacteraceae bacterium]|jgi:uncharacterized Ntn-hydrolase superfamily protein|nr:DUF1028 domain-containing protein [Ktedonobacteraceae bacterium]
MMFPSTLYNPFAHTYSIIARDPHTGQMGVAVQSHAFAVGAIVPWAEAGVGVVATQAFANLDYGPEGLSLMRDGLSAARTLSTLLKQDENREMRQVALLDGQGTIAVHTGSRCISAAGHLIGVNFSVQANMMVNDSIWPAMKQAYEEAESREQDLADRMIAALEAAQQAGGDIRGQQAAALLIVAGERCQKTWQGRLFDLRVDDHPHPVEELKRLVSMRRAWLLFEQSYELALAQRFGEALPLLKRALELEPEITEIAFRASEILFMAGELQEALALLHRVFAREPLWAEMIPRLVAVGLLPDDPALIKLILDQRS